MIVYGSGAENLKPAFGAGRRRPYPTSEPLMIFVSLAA